MIAAIAIDLSPNWLAFVLVAAAMGLAVWAYMTRYGALSPRQRGILLAARLVALAGLLIAAFAPVLSLPIGGKARNRLLVLVDHSGSMSVRDGAGGKTRREAADSAAAAIAASLSDRYDVRTAAFGATLGPFARGGTPPAAAAVSGGETALGDAIRAALERNDPDSVAAILVVSDGAVNRGEDPDRALGGAVPAYALWAGAAQDPPSVSLAGVDVSPDAVAGRPAPVYVRVRQGNRAATEGTVRLLEDGVEKSRARFSLGAPGASASLTLPYTPTTQGVHFLHVAIDGVDDDPLTANKQRLVALHARASTRQLAIVASRWDWDLRSLARGATEDTSWSVARYRPSPVSDDVATLDGTRLSFDDALKRASAVAVRYDARTLPAGRAATLAKYVERGGGVLLWIEPGGTLPPEGPLSKALGVVWRRWADAPGIAATLELAPAGRMSEVALLGGDAASASAAWNALPPVAPIVGVEGAHGSAAPGAGAALTPILYGRIGDERVPILLTGSVGAGRVAVLNAAGVYRWGLTAGGLSAGGVEGAFFGGLCRWLESAGNDRPVRIEAPDVSAEGAGVPIRLVSSDGAAGGAPGAPGAPPASARVTVRPEGGGAPIEAKLAPSGDGTYSGTLDLPPGVHRVQAVLERAGRAVGRDSLRIAVGEGGLEYEALAAEPGTMERLASGSGGLAASLAQPKPVMERLRRPDAARARLAEIDLFHNPFLFALVILALAAEWALRKRFHLL
ncbi:MAG TPA: hypothetical protein VFS09_06450 [Candidatus Eisenbacteria bacterium]|nr:hypothetical protein [Candidatus Eisenbacteria bacterium]